ncbi:RagB/SusD family nutrient uptake outer membrane protein [Parapedobacter koreensis]|uniref:Starch-binding associating with outer membrane n=1 Tax=Parapedobacter koreensis TaxID=332977 RepID=A0A1H7T2X8_9SPHI|nr:RagB/SusD family nutrient uptake outer membrane protein [Parapedobacter koreensis]SEL78147.1 Starch-binding associating with outer membrane [Parapedobacter koreensis]
MNTIKIYRTIFLVIAGLAISCTNLDEQLRSELEQGVSTVNTADLLIGAYTALNEPYQQEQRWVLEEISTDAAIAPTRGGDWDDNGIHRAIHLHTWNADNSYMNNTFVRLLTAVFQASNVLRNNPSAQQAAEARFIRALAMYDVLNFWGVVPYREDLEDFRADPITLQTQEAIDFIASELNAIISDLPSTGAAYVANQNAARTLLMKLHLNKGAFLNRQSPTFEAADMNLVIELANQVEASNRYTISAPGRYFDNFAPNNDAVSSENIFTLYNENGVRGGNVDRTWNTVSHYNVVPGGWNGWCTLSDYYDLYEEGDERLGIYYEYPADTMRNPDQRKNVGFFIGQQYNMTTGQPLNARNPSSQPLSYTREITIRTSGNTLETAGIRVMKYAFDYSVPSGQRNNDWVVFRYADVLLMKAEAILRGGTGTPAEALALVNTIRTNRGVAPFATLTLDDLIDERGRELYWEGWRRQDLIRFGKFLEPGQVRTTLSEPHHLVYPLPSQQIAVNPNLEQNPGY